MRPHTIHICDDETGILVYLTKLLTKQGYQVETFERGGISPTPSSPTAHPGPTWSCWMSGCPTWTG